jgi:hypothetical protein
LKLTEGSAAPSLPDAAKFVIHEVHRVPLKQQGPYLDWLKSDGLKLLEKHGFRPSGPWTTSIGRWSEVTLLFGFESLAERDKLIARFGATEDGRRYSKAIGEFVDEITTRLLLPAPFAKALAAWKTAAGTVDSAILPHLEQISPRVFAAGFADKFRSANCGFFAASNAAVLVDLPRGVAVAQYVSEVERLTGCKPLRLILTHADADDLAIIKELVAAGVRQIVASPATRGQILYRLAADPELPFRVCETAAEIGTPDMPLRFFPADDAAASCAAVELPSESVLFAGPLVVNGPRSRLTGTDTARWVDLLHQFESQGYKHVVPGFGSWTRRDSISRQRRFLEELRSQVAYAVALGKAPEALEKHVRISPDFQVWMPYDNPVPEDLLYVYRELTVPNSPFAGHEPRSDDLQPHALVLIGDGPHEPQHLEGGLAPAFAAAGVVPILPSTCGHSRPKTSRV